MRKSLEVARAKAAGAYATARVMAASLGYSQAARDKLPKTIAIVLWLPEAPAKAKAAIPEDLTRLLRAAHGVLMSTESDAPELVFFMDCTPLVPAGGSARDIMDKEVSDAGADSLLGKQITKPVSRILDKLLAGYRGSITLVGVAGGAPLALCLQEHARIKSIERVVLLKPHISPATVNALLVKPAQSPPVVDVFFDSARDCQRRDAAVRHVYPKGCSLVLEKHEKVAGALYASLLFDPASGTRPSPAAFQAAVIDPDEMDSTGRNVWWSDWTFELSRATKQPETVVSDLDPWTDKPEATLTDPSAALPSLPSSPRSSPRSSRSSPSPTPPRPCPHGHDGCGGCPGEAPTGCDQQQLAGALILRGSRCVLVRSLEEPPAWTGMRIPWLEVRANESALECAYRSAAEACDIEEHVETELEQMPAVPPAALLIAGEARHLPPRRALIYPLYATRPPPEGPLEDADDEDEDDAYDWYTWPRAVSALAHDPRAIDALRTLACGIAAAVNARAVASKWGGYFGQEWLEPAVPVALTTPPQAAVVPSKQAPTASMAQPLPSGDSALGRLSALEGKVEHILQCLASGAKADVSALLSEATPSFAEVINAPDVSSGAHEASSGVEASSAPDAGRDAEVNLDVVIVGAGAAGIGCAHTLTRTFGLEPSRVLLLERGEAVGTSFRMWPEEMRFISPSFNQQGWTSSFDLNSVAYGTSPAYTLHAQHPSGEQYAEYLSSLAERAAPVMTRTEVLRVEPVDGVFDVHVRTGFVCSTYPDGKPREETIRARYVVWAAGEFQYPREKSCGMPGMELCLHNSRVRSWAKLPGDDFVVIGGYESGSDATFNLAKAGKRVTMLASTACWNVQTADPSTELAPYTAERLRMVTAPGFSPRPRLLAPLRALRVEKAAGGGFNIVAAWKAAEAAPAFKEKLSQLRQPMVGAEVDGTAETGAAAGVEGEELVVHTPQPPVLATGFEGSVASAARHLFKLADESDEAKGCLAGAPLLTKDDESTTVPGVFLVGPTVRHGELSFCFVYKFRQRFGIVADAICRGLGRDTTAPVAECRKMDMYLDDFACCKSACGEAC